MMGETYSKIDILLRIIKLGKLTDSIEKLTFGDASYIISGNFLLISTNTNEDTVNHVFNLDHVKSFKHYKGNENK